MKKMYLFPPVSEVLDITPASPIAVSGVSVDLVVDDEVNVIWS